MNDDASSSSGSGQKGWFEKLSQALLGEPRDREQLIEVLRDAQERNLLDVDALTMIEGVLQVSEMQVRDIMIPRSQMSVIDRDMPVEQMLDIVIASGHSRFPVIADSRDEVAGILLAKDLLRLFRENETGNVGIMDMLRPAIFIPESKRLNVLLKEFRASRNHMAIVVDEYGGVSGMVTIEDVLEQIVGEIEDEHDVEEGSYILKHDDEHFTVKALTPVDEFNEYFHTRFSEEEFDTVGGLLLSQWGYVPKRGETTCLGNIEFRVLRSDKRRIHLLEVLLSADCDEQPFVSG
jgi:magnesium and cobalt transporter